MRPQSWVLAIVVAIAFPLASFPADQPIESELKQRFEGKIVRLYPTTNKELFRLRLPDEDERGAAPDARIYVKVESVSAKKNRIEFHARRVVPYATLNGQQNLAAGSRHEYRVEWRGTAPGDRDLLEAVGRLAHPIGSVEEDWPDCENATPQPSGASGDASERKGPQPQRIGGDVEPPACEFCPDPYYTKETRQERIEGVVVVYAVITESGQAACLRIGKSLHPQLDASAALAVGTWRFKPAMKRGKPVYVYLTVEVNFRPYSNRILQ